MSQLARCTSSPVHWAVEHSSAPAADDFCRCIDESEKKVHSACGKDLKLLAQILAHIGWKGLAESERDYASKMYLKQDLDLEQLMAQAKREVGLCLRPLTSPEHALPLFGTAQFTCAPSVGVRCV